MIAESGLGVEPKLTAILCADVHGYSRLMGEDEEATLVTLTAHRKIIDQLNRTAPRPLRKLRRR